MRRQRTGRRRTPHRRKASPLGRRLRAARTSLGLTLKDVESASGFSATHISEIERGGTSPTIGALVRIAAALGREPGYFLDESPLATASLQRDRLRVEESGVERAASTPLTTGVASGTLAARRVDLPPGGRTELEAREEICGYVLNGRVTLDVGETSWALDAGDSFHCAPGDHRVLRTIDDDSVSLVIVTGQSSD